MTSHLIGVVADTHGLLRPEVVPALNGVELIVHAGDVGKPEILDALRAVAPVYAVRGNMDFGVWVQALPETQVIEVGTARLYMLHKRADLDFDPAQAGYHAVIYGHSHQPHSETIDGVLYLNPGSIGARRFNLPISMALLHIDGTTLSPQRVDLG